jgi:hypothetical protein
MIFCINPMETKVGLNFQKIPHNVWILGFVSLLTDISSETIHSLLPLFLVSVLGAGVLTVGLIEGIAEATASVFKIFSGALSDYLHWLNPYLHSRLVRTGC